jgi:hypothetical protein
MQREVMTRLCRLDQVGARRTRTSSVGGMAEGPTTVLWAFARGEGGSGPAALSSRGRGERLPPAVPAKQSSRGSGTERHYSRSPVSHVPCRPCCLLLSRERSPPCDAAAVPCKGAARFASSCLPICPSFCSRARTWFVENRVLTTDPRNTSAGL